MTSLISRRTRVAASLAMVAAFAAVPGAASAADTVATGMLSAGSLTNTAPAMTPFTATLTGVTQTVTTAVGTSNVIDARGNNAGYSITVAASDPTVDGDADAAGTGAALTLTPTTATAAAGNPATTGPVAAGAQPLSTTAATIQNAVAGTGQGQWNFPAAPGALSVVIPGDASAGAYSSTLTYTTAAAVA